MNKDLIRARFAKSLATYNENAKIQKRMAEKLISLLDSNSYSNILEIGCGTGFLTELIDKKIEFKKYTALDIVNQCEDYIKNINPQINFINIDVEEFVSKNTEKYDLIISNASLQWVNNFEEIIKKLKQNLPSSRMIPARNPY